jgi:predicted RNA binding protein YcfA (HicA-like mRNA interferase family)
MPKLPSIKPNQIIKFLKANNFVLDHVSGSHYIFYNPQNKKRAVVPQHNRDIPKGTLMSLLRESGFTREDIFKYFNS